MTAERFDIPTWFSTYGLLTAERILERFQIKLSQEKLLAAIKDSHNFYYQLLRVPLKNIFNGIILAQARDYRTYAQKLFVDYLVAGAQSNPEATAGASIREDLEHERTQLIAVGDRFLQTEYNHQDLIAASQKDLISSTKNLPDMPTQEHAHHLEHLLIPYLQKTQEMHLSLCDYRSQFYNVILRCNELLQLLPDYRPDIQKQQKNRDELDFNATIGE